MSFFDPYSLASACAAGFDFAHASLEATPIFDVRAPVEFNSGSVPGSVNLPLLDDDQRHRVGLRYKEIGPDAAVELGHELISGSLRRTRIESWASFVRAHPGCAALCFRGGMRSSTVVRVLKEECGLDVPVVPGGYKAFRRFFLDVLDHLPPQSHFLTLSGRTGSGKTELLRSLPDVAAAVDLEGLANHRGSAFGAHPGSQPTTIDFENRVAVALLAASRIANGQRPVIVEDESRMIGRLPLPTPVFAALSQAPLIVIDEPLGARAGFLLRSYLQSDYGTGVDSDWTVADALEERVARNLKAISKALGGLRYERSRSLLAVAADRHRRYGDVRGHLEWIEYLLAEYYDPRYDSHLERNRTRVVLRGSAADVHAWLLNAGL